VISGHKIDVDNDEYTFSQKVQHKPVSTCSSQQCSDAIP